MVDNEMLFEILEVFVVVRERVMDKVLVLDWELVGDEDNVLDGDFDVELVTLTVGETELPTLDETDIVELGVLVMDIVLDPDDDFDIDALPDGFAEELIDGVDVGNGLGLFVDDADPLSELERDIDADLVRDGVLVSETV